ncbi:MAG: tRNA uridine-5-carboxymethylaminomethyl(34) synthesis GTPase MnmE [Syntrophobacteraceae bacterium]
MAHHLHSHDTICAIATPVGEGGIGIVKISGPEAFPAAARIFRRSGGSQSGLQPYRLHHGWIRDPSTDEPLDEVLLSTMPGPRSYTGEDVVEINCHSGLAVLERILDLVLAQGLRLAEPGEFTRRAFLNGRIDLTRAEAVIDVIHSRTRRSLELATRQLTGGVGKMVEAFHDGIVAIEAMLEAAIDFSDDLDEETLDAIALAGRLERELILPLRLWIRRCDEGRILREGLKIVLVGKPNVGKSSLLNGLVGRDRAIVTPFPGTTRDVVEDSFTVSGTLVRVLDTAGLRREPDPIEALGMERTRASVEEADFILWVVDRSEPLSEGDTAVHELIGGRRHLIVLNKADLPPAIQAKDVTTRFSDPSPTLSLSALASSDIDGLKATLDALLLREPRESLGAHVIPNVRHKLLLQAASDSLQRAVETLKDAGGPELTALELRTARQELEAILGLDGNEEVLDRIFSEFCIGK